MTPCAHQVIPEIGSAKNLLGDLVSQHNEGAESLNGRSFRCRAIDADRCFLPFVVGKAAVVPLVSKSEIVGTDCCRVIL